MSVSSLDDRTNVWVNECIIADAFNIQTRGKYRRRLPTHIFNEGRGDGSRKGFGIEEPLNSYSKDWEWTKACILSSSPTYNLPSTSSGPSNRSSHRGSKKNHASFPQQSPTLSILITDAESPFNRQTISIPSNLLNSEYILMANTWSQDINAESPNQLDKPPHSSPPFEFDIQSTTSDKTGKSNSTTNDFIPPADLIHLTHLHEPAVVNCLRIRYSVDEIYTSTGPILIALNPFKDCSVIYSDGVQRLYWEKGENMAGRRHTTSAKKKKKRRNYGYEDKKVDYDDGMAGFGSSGISATPPLPPHVYGVADDAFRSMMRTLDDARSGNIPIMESGDQSILVSGESGAGKTVTTKIIMHYLATLSRRSARGLALSRGDQEYHNPGQASGTIEQQVLQSNPILESFGNARTMRNDNSSRFGKYIEMQFTDEGYLIGANIETYLLEKVRLITPAVGERNYHIFYELLAGASASERNMFHLRHATPEHFVLTSLSGTFDRRDGVSDQRTYVDTRDAMRVMGLAAEERHEILLIVAALLHAGNLTFLELNDDEESQIDTTNPSLAPALNLMGVSAEMFNHALCFVVIEAGGERLAKMLSVDKARKALEALIKATYGALFLHLVRRINNSIVGPPQNARDAFIGVLDIFGFESFDCNSFEQLCINYCNEALQQQFNRFVFKMEQVEYEREGISWSFISFPDNQDVLDLIDKKHTGILSILDEQCLLAKCTDKTFVTSAYDKCSSHPRFSADRKQKAQGRFAVNHYAGSVEYTSHLFLEKNKDELPKDIFNLLFHSSNPFLQHLATMLKSSSNSPSNKENQRRSSSLVKISVGGQFSTQLKQLRERIDGTSPHYIRCIKPNDLLLPDRYDCAIVADQLRCGGILEAVRVSRVGYPQRYLHERFLERYRILAAKELRDMERTRGWKPQTPNRQTVRGTAVRGTCEVLVSVIARQIYDSDHPSVERTNSTRHRSSPSSTKSYNSTNKSRWQHHSSSSASTTSYNDDGPRDLIQVGMQMGKTKVFLRQWAFDIIEQIRGETKARAVTLINAMVRRFLARRAYLVLLLQYREHRSAYVHHNRMSYNICGPPPPMHHVDLPNFGETNYLIERYDREAEEENWRSCTEFKWVMIDGRWVRNQQVTPEKEGVNHHRGVSSYGDTEESSWSY